MNEDQDENENQVGDGANEFFRGAALAILPAAAIKKTSDDH